MITTTPGQPLCRTGSQEAMIATGGIAAPGIGPTIPAFIPLTPLQSYAGVILAPYGGSIDPVGVALAIFGPAGSILLIEATIRIETRSLLAEESVAHRGKGSRPVPWPMDQLPSTRMAWYLLLRTRRDPRMLSHLFPIAIGLLSFGLSGMNNPGFALSQGSSAALVTGVALSGGAYCLNPLGDDREQLPLILSSTASIPVLLRGRAIAGVVLGLLIGVGIGTPLLVTSNSPTVVLSNTVFTIGLLTAGTGVGLGMGAIFPRFERREYMNVERAHPSTIVVFMYLIGSLVVSVIGLLLIGWTRGGHTPIATAIVWAVYLAIVGLISVGGYAYAVSRFEGLTMDDV